MKLRAVGEGIGRVNLHTLKKIVFLLDFCIIIPFWSRPPSTKKRKKKVYIYLQQSNYELL